MMSVHRFVLQTFSRFGVSTRVEKSQLTCSRRRFSSSKDFGENKEKVKELLKDFKVILDHRIHWGDMDAYGHMNNVMYFRYLESARIDYFRRIEPFMKQQGEREETLFNEFITAKGIGPILKSVTCTYRFPVTYPDILTMGSRVKDTKEDRFTLDTVMVSNKEGKIAAEGSGVVVMYDYRKATKAKTPIEILNALKMMESQLNTDTL